MRASHQDVPASEPAQTNPAVTKLSQRGGLPARPSDVLTMLATAWIAGVHTIDDRNEGFSWRPGDGQ